MIKFEPLTPEFYPDANHLYTRFMHYLEDDFSEDTLAGIVNRTYPFFHIILSDTVFAGFVYLDNITGSAKQVHSAELVTCVHPRFWGDFTRKCADIYLKKCFEEFGFKKIKGLVYPDNFRIKNLLQYTGFKKEGLLKSETIRQGKEQDIEVYSKIRSEQ